MDVITGPNAMSASLVQTGLLSVGYSFFLCIPHFSTLGVLQVEAV